MISVKGLKNFDPAEYLESDEDIAIFLDEAFKSGSAKHIVNALGIVARAKVEKIIKVNNAHKGTKTTLFVIFCTHKCR